MVEDDIPVLGVITSNFSGNWEAKVLYRREYDVLNFITGTGLPEVYVAETLTEPKHDKSPISAHDGIHQQPNESYCSQASAPIWFPVLTWNYNKNWFSIRILLVHAIRAIHIGCKPYWSYRYDSMRRKYYWSHMKNDIYTSVEGLSRMQRQPNYW